MHGAPALHGQLCSDSFWCSSPLAFFYSGTAAVLVFCVLSGYVLTRSVLRAPDRRSKLVEMSLKRYWRLGIPATASCLVMALALLMYTPPVAGLPAFAQPLALLEPNLLDAFVDGSVRAMILGKAQYNGPLWTMALELQGSLLVFLILALWPLRLLRVALCALAIGLFFVKQSITLGAFACFVLGMLMHQHGRPLPLWAALPMLLGGLFLAGYHGGNALYQPLGLVFHKRPDKVAFFLAGVLIVYACLFNRTLSHLLAARWTVFLGKISFAAYLMHMVVLAVIGLPVFAAAQRLGLGYGPAACLASGATLAATAFERWVDRPVLCLLDRWAKTWTHALLKRA